jgi:hypothetical protein
MHFDDITWLGFVQGTLTRDERWLLEQHLNVGCSECSTSHAFWSRLADLIAREANYKPDASDIRVATAAFTGENREAHMPKTTLAQLIFDSFRNSAPAGFRSALMQARHAVFSGGQWTISLRIKDEVGDKVSLAGHITKADSGTADPGTMQVSLRQADSRIATATTNHSGEFHMRYERALNVTLLVKISQTETLEIPIPDQDITTEDITLEE